MLRKTNPIVSILTPTYNHEKYIEQCINSVLNQAYEDWEQIIIDDGSTDDTAKIIERIPDSRIRYYYQENQGVFNLVKTYNYALNLARGKFIAILEGDDFWPPDKLSTLIPILIRNPEVILAYGITRLVSGKGNELKATIPSLQFLRSFSYSHLFNDPIGSATKAMANFKGRTYTFPVSTIIQRASLESIGGFQYVPGLPLTDYSTFLSLSLKGKFYFINKVTGYWRRHNLSSSLKFQKTIQEKVFAYCIDFIKENNIDLSDLEYLEIMKSWDEGWHEISLTQGRAMLINKKWQHARSYFCQSIRSKKFTYKVASCIGLLASYLHYDIESLIRMFGKSTIKW